MSFFTIYKIVGFFFGKLFGRSEFSKRNILRSSDCLLAVRLMFFQDFEGAFLVMIRQDLTFSPTDDVSCSDLRTVRNVTAASTFVYLILEITSFIGLICACVGTCCASKVWEI